MPNTARRTVLVLSALSMHVGLAWSQPASEEEELALAYGDKSTVSIATGSKQPLRRAPAVATVITAQDIAAMGAVDLDDVLETVPGIHVSRSHNGFGPLYLIRGIHSEFNPQTLMLQNGVPMTTLFVGNRGNVWSGLPVEHIARIEVIRGPGSALYGADAFSGVINIITKTAADVAGAEVGARAGSFKSRDGWVQYGGTAGAFDIAAYLRVGRTDGQRETVQADAQTAFDALFGTSASLAPGPMNVGFDAVDGHLDVSSGKLRLRAGYKLRDEVGTGVGVGASLDPVGKLRSQRTHLDLSWSELDLAPDLKATLAASGLHYIQRIDMLMIFPPGAFGGAFPTGMLGAPSTWERQWRLSAVATYTGWSGHTLRFGAGYDDLDLYRTRELKNFDSVFAPTGVYQEVPVSQSFMVPQRRSVRYVYAQDEWNFAKDWTLTAGVRHDRYSDFGSTTNPRMALVWDARHDFTAKLLYGRAFRAPAFTEQYSINNPVIQGNPALRPERIATTEAAFSWQASVTTQINLNLFRYHVKDFIRAGVEGGVSRFTNTGEQKGRGLELETVWDASRRLRVAGNLAWQRSVDETTQTDAGYAPRVHMNARADWSFANGWLLGGQVNHVGDRQRAAGDARPAIRDNTTLDLTLRSSLGKGRWEFAASVRNLFDADVREPSLAPGTSLPNDIPMAGRSLYLQAMLRL